MAAKISPSILSADFSKLGEEIKSIEPLVDMLHVDVMDGHFVPNITVGVPVVKSLKAITKLPLDVHLMISNPADMVEPFAKAGADIITFHAEAAGPEVLDAIKKLGKKAGVAINPETPLEKLNPYLKKADMILIMSVNPGFAGQGFIDVTQKIKDLRKTYKGDIEVDGGINSETAPKVVKAGANILVSGSYLFGAQNRREAIQKLKGF